MRGENKDEREVMGKMKKLIALFLALSMVLALCGCGGPKASDVTIDSLGKAIGSTFSKQTTNNGFIFSDTNAGNKVNGEADKNEHLYNVTIVLTEVNTSFLREIKKASDIVYYLNNYTKLKLSELQVTLFLLLADQTISLLSYGKTSVTANDTKGKEIVIEAKSGDITENGWKYTIVVDDSAKTATFTATFVGY